MKIIGIYKEEVFDPETGGYIDNITGCMKGTIEVVSYFGKDSAVTVVHSDSGFQENDQQERDHLLLLEL